MDISSFLKMVRNKIIGLVETVIIKTKSGDKELKAKIDTGATKSSIDMKLASSMQLGPVIKSKMIKSAHGNKLRPVIEVELILANNNTKSEFTLADRRHMKFQILIGQNTLKKGGYLIDPNK